MVFSHKLVKFHWKQRGSTEILTLNKTTGDAPRSALQDLLQLFCRSLGGVLWAGIFSAQPRKYVDFFFFQPFLPLFSLSDIAIFFNITDICLPSSSLQLQAERHQIPSEENNSVLLFHPERYWDLFTTQEKGRGNLPNSYQLLYLSTCLTIYLFMTDFRLCRKVILCSIR